MAGAVSGQSVLGKSSWRSRFGGYALVLLACAIFQLGANTVQRTPHEASWWADSWWTLLSGAATLACWQTSRRANVLRFRRAWAAYAAGCACWFVGQLIWDGQELLLLRVTPFPSIGDAFYLMFAPAFLLGSFFYRTPGARRENRLKLIADIGLVAAVLVMAATFVLFGLAKAASQGWLYVLVALAYPVTRISVLLVNLMWFWQRVVGRRRLPVGTLIVAMAAMALADVMYSATLLGNRYHEGSWIDTCWIGCFSLILVATRLERACENAPPTVDAEQAQPAFIDSLAPAIAIFALSIVTGIYSDRFDDDMWPILFACNFFIPFFIGLRAWSTYRMERAYVGEVRLRHERQRAMEGQLSTVQRLQAVGTLASGAAHDFNNMLQAMMGQLSIMRRRASRGDDMKPAIEELERALWRASDLAGRLLSLSRRPDEQARAVQPTTVVQRVVGLLRTAVPPTVTVNAHSPETSPEAAGLAVKVVAAQLELALLNLGLNARDALRERGGTIDLGWDIVDDGTAIAFWVKDDGPGIVESALPSIFEPFFTTKPSGHGAGLGLTFVDVFAAHHGGEIVVHSVVGHGAQFRLTLPSTIADAVSRPPSSPTQRGTVLLVMQGNADELMLCAELEKAGYETILASDPAAVSGVLASDTALVGIVVDLALRAPNSSPSDDTDLIGDGWLRLRGVKTTPMIALAGAVGDVWPASLSPAWAAVLPKPVDPQRVIDVLAESTRDTRSAI